MPHLSSQQPVFHNDITQQVNSSNPEPTASPSPPVTQPSAQWSDSLQSVLDQPPANLPQRLILAGLLFSSIFGAWAWFGTVQEIGHAQGRLVPEGQAYKVQPVIQSEVAQILVREGEAVQAGQMIATLDQRLIQVEIERLEQTIQAYQAQLVDTRALIDKTVTEIAARQAIATADIQAQAEAIEQAKQEASTNQSLLQQFENEATAYQTRLDRLKGLADEGAIATDYLFEVEQALRDRQRAITQSQGQIEQSLSQAEQLTAELNRREAEATRVDSEAQQKLHTLEMELATVRQKITETETLLEEAKARLDKTHLYAPIAGIISSLNIDNSGEVVQPGQTIAEIAPEASPLILYASLPAREAGLIQVNMPVQIKFDAFPYQDYGTVSGKVTAISPDSKADATTGTFYQLEIALDRNYMIHENQRVELKAGQTANAEIIIRKRRIMTLLLDPIRRLQKGGINL